MTETLTLTDAGALAAILSAAERNAPVAYLTPAGNAVYAKARYIGGASQARDWAAEDRTDVRDLYLHVTETRSRAPMAWLIRNLISAHRTWRFMTDTGPLAQPFKAVGSPETSAPARPYEPDDLIEYVSHRAVRRPGAGQWVPGTFDHYVEGSNQHVYVRTLGQPSSPYGLRLALRSDVRKVPAELIGAARQWALDCAWLGEPDDIAGLTDAQVIAGIQRHYDGGWAQFAADGGRTPDSDRPEIRWEKIRDTGYPDQQANLPSGHYYAQIGPDGRPGTPWSWTIMNSYPDDAEIAGGWADSEQDAKAQVAAWRPASDRSELQRAFSRAREWVTLHRLHESPPRLSTAGIQQLIRMHYDGGWQQFTEDLASPAPVGVLRRWFSPVT